MGQGDRAREPKSCRWPAAPCSAAIRSATPKIKFGYAVTGLVDPERMLTNAGGRAGEILVLTKPLGTGIVATALKAGQASEETAAVSSRFMATLDAAASEAALRLGVCGATDVTGFGLAGHAAALARESGLTLEIDADSLPVLPGVLELALGFQAGGLKANRREFEPRIEQAGTVDERLRALLFDPQTSGGLLLLVPPAHLDELLAALPTGRVIGRALARGRTPLVVRWPT